VLNCVGLEGVSRLDPLIMNLSSLQFESDLDLNKLERNQVDFLLILLLRLSSLISILELSLSPFPSPSL